MLTEKIKSEIEKVDVLTDFDETMILENSPCNQLLTYFLYLKGSNRINLIKRFIEKYPDYRKDKLLTFYSLLAGCPIELLENSVCNYNQNIRWNVFVGNSNIGIVSRNNSKLIMEYLKGINKDFPINAKVVAANMPEIENGSYTGRVELIVDNHNLVDYVRQKEYICGNAEKNILAGYGLYFLKIGKGLYSCTNRKIF